MKEEVSGSHDGCDLRRDYFEHLAAVWDQKGQNPAATVERLNELAHEVNLQSGQDLLEVGCGTGQITGWLAAAVQPGTVVAVDFAPAMVLQARGKHPWLDVRVADVCVDPLGEASFDVVLCFHSFPHFRDMPAALGNIRRALRPGGRVIIMHLAGRAQINAKHTGFGGAVASDHLPGGSQWQGLLGEAGLVQRRLIDRDDLFLLEAAPVAMPWASA